jgi:hypothetical protein
LKSPSIEPTMNWYVFTPAVSLSSAAAVTAVPGAPTCVMILATRPVASASMEALSLIYKDCISAMFGDLFKLFNYVK